MGKSTRMMKESAGMAGEKLFAFFGSDLGARRAKFLRRLYQEGYSFLPLDSSAIGTTAAAGVPYVLIDEWLGPDLLIASRERAKESEENWFDSVKEYFISESICWPEFDREAMYWFWHDISAADTLAEAFLARGVERLMFYQNATLRPGLYYYPSDVVGASWKSRLQDRAEVLTLKEKGISAHRFLHPFLKRFNRKKSRRILRDSRWMKNASQISEKLLLVFSHGEFDRFTPIVRRLSQSFPGMVAAVILAPKWVRAKRIARQWSIPVARGPKMEFLNANLQEKFLKGYERALDSANGEPWYNLLASSQFHFRFYCEERWPILVSRLGIWGEFFQRARPKAVLVSSLEDSESQLPTVAAKQLGIPTFSIPHGGFSPRPLMVLVADYLLYSTPIQRALYERAGAKSRQLIACRDLVAENEYPVVSAKMGAVKPGWRILALTNPIGTGCLAQRILPGAQLKALRALANPPSNVVDKLSLRVKVHPGFPDLNLFDVVDSGLKKQVLPLDSRLSGALDECDLVVAVNYCGSALIHAMRAEKPVLFFWTDASIGKVEPYTHADLLTPAGPVVDDPKELWDCICAFFTDTKYEGQLRRRAYEYCRNHLDDSLYPDISEVLSEKLNGG